jgi:hypothetical protein
MVLETGCNFSPALGVGMLVPCGIPGVKTIIIVAYLDAYSFMWIRLTVWGSFWILYTCAHQHSSCLTQDQPLKVTAPPALDRSRPCGATMIIFKIRASPYDEIYAYFGIHILTLYL